MFWAVYYNDTAWDGIWGRVRLGRMGWDVVQAHFFALLLPVWSCFGSCHWI
jgi:hypothetical protein